MTSAQTLVLAKRVADSSGKGAKGKRVLAAVGGQFQVSGPKFHVWKTDRHDLLSPQLFEHERRSAKLFVSAIFEPET